MTETISDVEIPDTRLVAEATELVRGAAPPLIYHHSRRVYLFASMRGREQGLKFDPELLYVGAMFHDLGLTTKYRRTDQRFEIDGAAVRAELVRRRGLAKGRRRDGRRASRLPARRHHEPAGQRDTRRSVHGRHPHS